MTEIELADGGCLEKEDNEIRRRDKDGNTEEVRRPEDKNYKEWNDLFKQRAKRDKAMKKWPEVTRYVTIKVKYRYDPKQNDEPEEAINEADYTIKIDPDRGEVLNTEMMDITETNPN